MFAKSRITNLAAATVVALTLAGLGVSALAATSAKNNAATGYVVCVSKTTGDMKLRTKSTCPAGFTTKVFGAKGPAGVAGAPGADGAQGPAGSTGAQGSTGDPGVKGDMGPMGMPGAPGEQGIQGEQGLPGEQGERGANGVDGFSEVYWGSGWWMAVANNEYREMTRISVPAGSYFVQADVQWEYSGDRSLLPSWHHMTCHIENNNGQWIKDGASYNLSRTTIVLPISLSAPDTLKLMCMEQGFENTITTKEPSLSALKINQINY